MDHKIMWHLDKIQLTDSFDSVYEHTNSFFFKLSHTSFPEFTYRVLSDDVGGVSFWVIFCFLGGAEHMKQLLYSLLQQPVNQNLEQRQLRKKSFYWESQTGILLQIQNLYSVIHRAHPYTVGFKHHFNVLKKRKNILLKVQNENTYAEEELLHPVFTFISIDFPGAPTSPYGNIKEKWK